MEKSGPCFSKDQVTFGPDSLSGLLSRNFIGPEVVFEEAPVNSPADSPFSIYSGAQDWYQIKARKRGLGEYKSQQTAKKNDFDRKTVPWLKDNLARRGIQDAVNIKLN